MKDILNLTFAADFCETYRENYYVVIPYSRVHGANMGPIRVLSAQGGSHIVPMNLAIRDAGQPKDCLLYGNMWT